MYTQVNKRKNDKIKFLKSEKGINFKKIKVGF
jgi:hypothetical protein